MTAVVVVVVVRILIMPQKHRKESKMKLIVKIGVCGAHVLR